MQVSDIFRFKNAEIKALHLTWIAFFISFYVWFNMAPLASSMLRSVDWLTRDDIRLFAIANVALTIPARIIVGMALDRFGPRRVFSVLLVIMSLPTFVFAFGDTREVLFVSRLKPGKPLSLGQIGHALWLGLPGNPVAAFVTWHVIGQVLAGRMAGLSDPGPAKTLAALGAPIRHKPGRCEYRPARLPGHDARGVAQVICLDGAGSHRVAQLAGADALVMIPADVEAMSRGDLVEVLPL